MLKHQKNNLKVSIIIPNYNSLHIEECLKSCIDQRLNEFEIIIVDDNSTDDSWETICRYQHKYSSILKTYKNPSKGACSARNFGFKKSTGKYIQFLDSDDMLSSGKIQTQLRVLLENQNSVANCGWIHFIDTPFESDYKKQLIDINYDQPINWLVDSWNGGGMGQTGCWLIPRKLIEKSGLWNEILLKNQDGEFMSRVLSHAKGIKFVENVYALYRKPSAQNVSKNKSNQAIKSLLKSYKLYEKVLEIENSDRVKFALAQNYNSFVYAEYNNHPVLVDKAIKYIRDLDEKVNIQFSNIFIKMIYQIIGLHNTMKLRKISKRISSVCFFKS